MIWTLNVASEMRCRSRGWSSWSVAGRGFEPDCPCRFCSSVEDWYSRVRQGMNDYSDLPLSLSSQKSFGRQKASFLQSILAVTLSKSIRPTLDNLKARKRVTGRTIHVQLLIFTLWLTSETLQSNLRSDNFLLFWSGRRGVKVWLLHSCSSGWLLTSLWNTS